MLGGCLFSLGGDVRGPRPEYSHNDFHYLERQRMQSLQFMNFLSIGSGPGKTDASLGLAVDGKFQIFHQHLTRRGTVALPLLRRHLACPQAIGLGLGNAERPALDMQP